MLVNNETLEGLRQSFSNDFQDGFGQAQTNYMEVATVINSTTAISNYGFIAQLPNVRKWLGDRVVHSLQEKNYQIKNDDFELTIGVPQNDMADDNLGQYTSMFQEMGRSTAAHPDQLVFEALKNGFTETSFDGQYFFDTDHPVLDENGDVQSVSNFQDGAGDPWFLLDTSRAIKPIVLQNRSDTGFVSRTDPTDENVWSRKEYEYGTHIRRGVGYGLWFMAYASKAPLTEANFEAALAALQEMRGDHGRPLGIMPNLLVTKPSMRGDAKRIVEATFINGGDTNVNANAVRHLQSPWLL